MTGEQKRTGLIAVGVVAGLLLAITVAAFVASRPVSVPLLASPSEDWSHKELIEHLKSKGLKFFASQTDSGTYYGPAMHFRFVDDSNKVLGTVYVQKRANSSSARDEAGVHGEEGFSWGRFLFVGKPTHMGKIKKAL